LRGLSGGRNGGSRRRRVRETKIYTLEYYIHIFKKTQYPPDRSEGRVGRATRRCRYAAKRAGFLPPIFHMTTRRSKLAR